MKQLFIGKHLFGFGNITFVVAGALMVLSFVSLVVFSPNFRELLNSPVKLEKTLPSETAVANPVNEANSSPVRSQGLLAKILPQVDSQANSDIVFNQNQPASSDSILVLPSLAPYSFEPADPEEKTQAPFVKVLISEVLFGRKDNSKYEFVELYNPNDFSVDLTGWELRKRTESGADSVLVFSQKFSGAIPSRGYFLISHPDVAAGLSADLVWSSAGYSLAENNAIYLFDSEARLVDLLGCGQAFDYESISCLAPGKDLSVSRISETDTNNNQNDFSVSFPTPQNSFQNNGFIQPNIYSVHPSSSPAAMNPSPILVPSPSILPSPSLILSPSPMPILSPSPLPSPTPILSIAPTPSPAPTELMSVQIIEVQFGLEGNADADFVKMYNPNSAELDLKPYKLFNKTANGISSSPIKSWSREGENGIISAQTYFYWVNSGYQEKIDELTNLGFKIFTTTGKLTKGVALEKDGVIAVEIDNL
ncbi:MAG: lamin tail domain-containing protein [Patescibacteria group bacterium]